MALDSEINYFNLQVAKDFNTTKSNVIAAVEAQPTAPGLVIDVIKDHRLFANNRGNIDAIAEKMPFVYVIENKLLTSSLVNQYSYFQPLLKTETELQGVSNPQRGKLGSALDAIINFGKNLVNISSDAALATARTLIGEVSQTASLDWAPLAPYNGLYNMKPTGFQYAFPFYSDNSFDVNNKFTDNFSGFLGMGDVPSVGKIPNVFKTGSEVIKSVSETFLSYSKSSYMSPATYVEIPQYFAPGEYETITINFDLFNTYDQSDVQKNYDLLFLLAFQNLPFREDISRVQPPKIYSLSIPGQTYLPYCYMKSFKVTYKGNRRLIKDVNKYEQESPNTSPTPKKQRVIIPDCYGVQIEFLSLVKPSGNFLLVPDIRVESPSSSVNVRTIEQNQQSTPVASEQPQTLETRNQSGINSRIARQYFPLNTPPLPEPQPTNPIRINR